MSIHILAKSSIVIATMLLVGCSEKISFESDIVSILDASCVDCHSGTGEGVVKSGLILDSYDNVMKGTQYGPVVTPGKAYASTLYLVISHSVAPEIQMPPHHHEKYPMGAGEPLSEAEIKTIENWIDLGAMR